MRPVPHPPRFTYSAPCGDEFDTDRDAQDHELTCGACAGATDTV